MAGDASTSKVNLRVASRPGPSHGADVGEGVADAVVIRVNHADHSELMEYFHRITGPKKQIYLVHGEPLRSLALQSALMEEYPDKSFTFVEMSIPWSDGRPRFVQPTLSSGLRLMITMVIRR